MPPKVSKQAVGNLPIWPVDPIVTDAQKAIAKKENEFYARGQQFERIRRRLQEIGPAVSDEYNFLSIREARLLVGL